MIRQSWWRYQEGIFLLGTSVALMTAMLWLCVLYSRGLASASRSSEPRCDMSFVMVMVALLLILCALPFLGWQVALVRRRVAGKPITVWGVVAFLGGLLPIFYLGYIVLAM